MLFLTISGFAATFEVKPFNEKFCNSVFECTSTAYGLYTEPDGSYTDVSCTVTTTSCAAANAAAEDCRNQNVCNRVRANGGTPSSQLNCKKDTFEDPV